MLFQHPLLRQRVLCNKASSRGKLIGQNRFCAKSCNCKKQFCAKSCYCTKRVLCNKASHLTNTVFDRGTDKYNVPNTYLSKYQIYSPKYQIGSPKYQIHTLKQISNTKLQITNRNTQITNSRPKTAYKHPKWNIQASTSMGERECDGIKKTLRTNVQGNSRSLIVPCHIMCFFMLNHSAFAEHHSIFTQFEISEEFCLLKIKWNWKL